MEMSTVKNVTIVALLLGAAYLAYANRRRLMRLLRSQQRQKPMRQFKAGDAMTAVCQAFLLYADNFQGLFEPMYKASLGTISRERMCNVLKEWDIRMGSIAQTPICLRSWWATVISHIDALTDKDLQGRAQIVVQMIRLCGIVRDDRTEIEVKDDTGMFYQQSEGGKMLAGQKLRIESPCWYLPGMPIRIIEKGYCGIK